MDCSLSADPMKNNKKDIVQWLKDYVIKVNGKTLLRFSNYEIEPFDP